MYVAREDVETPEDDAVIWRYMNLERLIALLLGRTLFVPRLDQYRDPWEGVWPAAIVANLRRRLPLESADALLKFSDVLREHLFASCWHLSPHESAGLWHQYATASGFAVKSTVGRLKHSVTDGPNFLLGKVRYIDFSIEHPGERILDVIHPAFFKRKSFEHEQEVRLVILDMPKAPLVDDSPKSKGKTLPLNLELLVEQILVSPDGPKWIEPQIRELLNRLGFGGIEVSRSDLYSPHVY